MWGCAKGKERKRRSIRVKECNRGTIQPGSVPGKRKAYHREHRVRREERPKTQVKNRTWGTRRKRRSIRVKECKGVRVRAG
jgi:hypothetical protein